MKAMSAADLIDRIPTETLITMVMMLTGGSANPNVVRDIANDHKLRSVRLSAEGK